MYDISTFCLRFFNLRERGDGDERTQEFFTLASTETEPNDDPSNATNITIGNWIEGNIGTAEDEDWYYFYSDDFGKLTVYLENIPSGCDYDVYFYKLEDTTLSLESYSLYNGDHYEVLSHEDAEGFYFIRIVTYTGYNPSENYRLYTHYSYSYDNYEPNDSLHFAYQLTPGDTQHTATLDNEYDHDWYVLDINSGDKIFIDLYSLPDDYDLFLYDDSGVFVDRSINGQTSAERIAYTANSTGTYRILVNNYSWSNGTAQYKLGVTKVSSPVGIIPVSVQAVADEEFRTRYGDNWQNRITELVSQAGEGFESDFGIQYNVNYYVAWDSDNSLTTLSELLQEAIVETTAPEQVKMVFTTQTTSDGYVGLVPYAGADEMIVKDTEYFEFDWDTTRHEASHVYYCTHDGHPEDTHCILNQIIEYWDVLCVNDIYNNKNKY